MGSSSFGLTNTKYILSKRTCPRAGFAIIMVAIIGLSLSCVPERKMTLEEAKQVTVSTGAKTFTPPPRTIDDILSILEGTNQKEIGEMKEAEIIAAASPPAGASDKQLIEFYMKQLQASFKLGRFRETMEKGKEMARLLEKVDADPIIYSRAGRNAKLAGDIRQAIRFFEDTVRKADSSTGAYKELVELYLSIGDFESARKRLDAGSAACIRYANPKYRNYRIHEANLESMRASYLEAEGKYAAAEPLRRKALKLYQQHAAAAPNEQRYWYEIGNESFYLIYNLREQGRVVEAEAENRALLKKSVELFGGASEMANMILAGLGHILMREGRPQDAERLARMGIRNMQESGAPADSYYLCRGRHALGEILTGKKAFEEAMSEFDQAMLGFSESNYYYQKLLRSNPSLLLSMVEAGRFSEASDRIREVYERNVKFFGENHYLTAEIRALRGLLNYRQKKIDEALADYSSALPALVAPGAQTESDYLRKQNFITIMEGYLDLLKELGTQQARAGMDPMAESFKVADLLMGRSVSSALAESSARAAVTDKDLAELIRKEQDASKEVKALEAALTNLAAMAEAQQAGGTAENLRTRMETLIKARVSLLVEIQSRFPRYSDFTNPQPSTPQKVQAHLRPGEALIVIYSAEKGSHVWCVPQHGDIRFAASRLGRKDLSKIVGSLRKSLSPDPSLFGDIPEFDPLKAYGLYQDLLKPVEEAWRGASNLLIVAPGPLGQIPFSVLPMESSALKEESGVLFSRYREVPWLIRKVSLSRYPSVTSFMTLRTLPEGDPKRKAYAGFGDPLFAPGQATEPRETEVKVASRGGQRIHVRGIRTAEGGKPDIKKPSSSTIDKLNRLPDTGDEVRDIALSLGAQPESDTFTGKRASERQVKTMDLADRRVIAFASHALLPWDLDGLDQPAIALSAPSVTGDNDDGLLTMDEIMKLRLNADWVVLSACNTGASEGEGAEAVSGLGKAFFYAGTRAVLVTMWPVETTSAKNLMTGLFSHYAQEKGLPRAQAHRKSINELIDSQGLKDIATGKTIASYAHPFFWAPYIIMGDGG